MNRAYGVAPLPHISRPPITPKPSTRGLTTRTRLNIRQLLQLKWPPQLIADRESCSVISVYRVASNLHKYGSVRRPLEEQKPLGRPPKLSEEDEEALFEELVRSGWMYQDEIAHWLLVERGVRISQKTVSRLLKRRKWSARSLRPYSINRNEELREAYRNCMRNYAAEDIVFLDESIFNEKTGWRHKAYAPVGHEARYTQSIDRGKTWAILPAYTVNGYLSCTAIKQGYFNGEEFLDWIQNHLIPALRDYFGIKPGVIVLDNVSIHVNPEVERLLTDAGYIVRYLPPYSPDYNPIELTFGVLKAWIRRNYIYRRNSFSNFGKFLEAALQESGCDSFARKHFSYAAGGLYLSQEQLDQARQEMRELFL